MTENEQPEIEETHAPETHLSVAKKNSFKERMGRFFGSKKGKVVSVLVALVVIAGVIYAIPASRYAIAGSFIKRNVHIAVTDSTTQKPVSDAELVLGSFTAKTDANGVVDISNVPAGEYTLRVTKAYYTDMNQAYEVPVFGEAKEVKASLVATGRQVVVSVTNKITKAALMGATVSVGGITSVTNDKGIATMVLPADKDTFDGKVMRDGYNEATVKVKASDQSDANVFTATPSGSLFYLSKKSGKIDVMKSNLDGSGATVIVKGTGNESDNDTRLFPSSDWRYLMLSARRDTSFKGQLYLVDTKTNSLTLVDKGSDSSFSPVGWSDHTFVYSIYRNSKRNWESGRYAIKSYDINTSKIVSIAESQGSGTQVKYEYERLDGPIIVDGKLAYSISWERGEAMYSKTTKKNAVVTVNIDGTNKVKIKEFSMNYYGNVQLRYMSPVKFSIQASSDNKANQYFQYDSGNVSTLNTTDETYWDTSYPLRRTSPDGEKTLWYEARDGKNSIFLGNSAGAAGKEIATESDYTVFGWYSDDYILLTKNSSELYIAAVNKAEDGMTTPVKVANYHKAAGYWGYGGQ
ncbi:MAG: carboxypeptidase regulatory-like domain-containing protein [Candidatus Saccharibacteria bacterium]|nr:MAG: carboxypeptidase regulatory-like domain-containing protein [Candidatus Saccharibacteria bacterium]